MTTRTREALGARIRKLRELEGLSQAKLALMVDVERSYLAKLEAGTRNPSIDIVEKIAHGLGITLSELFDGLDSAPAKDPDSGKQPSSAHQTRYSHMRIPE